MRICLISREYPPDTGWGGIGAYTYQHARALKELGHDVEVISLTKKESKVDYNAENSASDPLFVPVHRAAWGPLLEELSTVWISLPYTHFVLKSCLALWRKFLEIHQERPFDVVEAPEHLAEALFPALTGICPLVIRLHTPHSKFIKERYHNLNSAFDQELVAVLERVAMLEAEVLSSPSEDLAAYVAQDCAVKPSEIEIVRNPVDCTKFQPEGPKAIAADGKPIVFFAGRLEERKGVHYLVDAIPSILEKHPGLHFVVLGADTNTGPGKSSVLSELKRKLQEASCESSVQFINHVALDQMPAHYRSADICVVPSLYENAPYTVLEAQASGKPVVGTSAGGSKEYIFDGETGYVVPARDSKALADAICKLLDNEALRLEMGRNARKVSLEKFDKTIIVKNALKTYELAIQRKSARAENALYRRSPEQSLSDFVSMLYSYHLNLCDLIYRHSFSYRVTYWMQLAFRRPRLCGAKILLSTLKRISDSFSFAPRKIEELKANMERQVNEREMEKERLLLKELMTACMLGGND
ncbi:MAG: glycosyltransferase family 4 protein [Candidatus Obscuribacterales bacterium]|nr:glycosyltransferase family 4 protein [Candidatus Obscuribacterales bacterium]